jgi:hypothetical protein
MWKNNILLRNSEQVLPKLQREGDFFSMERLILSGGLTAEQEIHFNRCRLSYQAMTLADIMTGDGSKVTKHALEVSHLSRASSKWDWPNERPCNWDIRCWHKRLCLITSENWGLPFLMHLERWIHPSHLNWQWFYQRQDCSLYHLVNIVCHVFLPFSPCCLLSGILQTG